MNVIPATENDRIRKTLISESSFCAWTRYRALDRPRSAHTAGPLASPWSFFAEREGFRG